MARLVFLCTVVTACAQPSGDSSTVAAEPAAAAPAPAPAAAQEPAPAPASGQALTAEDERLLADFAAAMEQVKVNLNKQIAVLEKTGADCEKAAAGLMALDGGGAALETTLTAFKDRLGAHPELRNRARAIMEAAFPPELRTKAEAVISPVEQKCAANPAFRDALRQKGMRKAKPGG